VADLFRPKSPPWAVGPGGQTPIAASDLNRIEAGIEALDSEVDAQGDRLDAVQAQLANVSASQLLVVTTATRPAPAKGRMVFDDTLGRPIVGTGTSWIEVGGGDVGGPGSSTAPTNFTAVVQSDNSIVCSWTPPPGATHSKLYEVRSPEGVAGADSITGTTTTRTPGSMGYYEYWATSFVGGVESAQSNHGICSLPYGSNPANPGNPGGGTAGSPAELLAFEAGGGSWNLGVGYPSGHKDISRELLMNGWQQAPYFFINPAGTHVHFQVPMNGGTTSERTEYPRSELREYLNGIKAEWHGSEGSHFMGYRATVLHMEAGKQECVIGQIHNGDDDTLQIRCEGTTWRAAINGSKHPTILGNFPWGTEVAVGVRLVSGLLTIQVNGQTRITTDPGYGPRQYFKNGLYVQQNDTSDGGGNPSNGYASCLLRDLVVSHS
jgi:hypothetical protein